MKKLLLLFIFVCSTSAFTQTRNIAYEEVELTDIGSVLIPSILELQSGAYREFSDKNLKSIGFDASGDVIYQQAGRNGFFKQQTTYARFMIKETKGKSGAFLPINTKMSLTDSELKQLDLQLKTSLIDQFKSSGAGVKLVRWEGVTIDKISGFDALKTAYIRQLDNNPPVYVELYNLENYDREYLITISYRLNDSPVWQEVFSKVKNSIKITNLRKPPPILKKRSKTKGKY